MQNNVIILPSASRTTTQTNRLNVGDGVGLIAVLHMTTVGTGSVTLTVNGYDPVGGATWAILTGVAVTTNTTNVYRIYPGLTAAANATVSDIIPATIQLVVTANNANPAVYSLTVNLVD